MWARRLTHDEQDAGDLCQEVCIRVLLGQETFRGDAKFSTWLYRVTLNSYMDLKRKRSRSRETREADLGLNDYKTALDNYVCLKAQARSHLLADRVQATLRHLTPRQCRLLEWKYVEGLTNAEIAALLHIQEESVWQCMRRARAAFRLSYKLLFRHCNRKTSKQIERRCGAAIPTEELHAVSGSDNECATYDHCLE
jgi:RNA polymerase sigma-70 factor (ECF subfamily)